ncbi:MAG: hypothetical protein KBC02_02285 [Candidatus Pacebacteria bacterium]|nr:hypothetical protein [Candidatus Paceibacterota bacterium]
MPSPLENPFRPPIPTVVDYEKEAHAIGLLLGPKAEAAYRKRHAHDLSDPSVSVSVGLTAEEQAQMNEKPESQLASERKKEQIRAAWGMFFADAGLENAEALLDSMEIHDDGSVSLTGEMTLGRFTTQAPLFPTRIRVLEGNCYLAYLESARGLRLPDIIEGDLGLNGLESAEGLVLPKKVRSLGLPLLGSAEHLELPEITGSLFLSGLTSARFLRLPKRIDGDLGLRGLISAEHLVMPEVILGDLRLEGLTSAEHLVLPKRIGRKIYFKKLPMQDVAKLQEERPDLAGKIALM